MCGCDGGAVGRARRAPPADGEDRPMLEADVLLPHIREPPLLRFTGAAGAEVECERDGIPAPTHCA